MGNVKISYGIFKATSIYHNLEKRMKEVMKVFREIKEEKAEEEQSTHGGEWVRGPARDGDERRGVEGGRKAVDTGNGVRGPAEGGAV